MRSGAGLGRAAILTFADQPKFLLIRSRMGLTGLLEGAPLRVFSKFWSRANHIFSTKPNFQIFDLIFAGKRGELAVIWNPELEPAPKANPFRGLIHRSETIASLA